VSAALRDVSTITVEVHQSRFRKTGIARASALDRLLSHSHIKRE
jgi:hypothetical protein